MSTRCVLRIPLNTLLVSNLRHMSSYPEYSPVGLHILRRLIWEKMHGDDGFPEITPLVALCMCQRCWVVKPWLHEHDGIPFCLWCWPEDLWVSRLFFMPEEVFNFPHCEAVEESNSNENEEEVEIFV